jgi:hypothetical protein
MGYEIDIILHKKKYKENIIEHAIKNNCIRHYTNYEISGIRGHIHNNKFILTFIFPEEQIYLIRFIEYIKNLKCSTIETISYDNCVFHILYPPKKCKKKVTKEFENILKILK